MSRRRRRTSGARWAASTSRPAEVERRFARVRDGHGARRPRRGRRGRQRVLGLRGRRHVPLGLPDRPSLRVRAAPAAKASRRSCSPSEARYVGEHGTTWIEEQVFVDHPGEWLRDRARDRGWARVGVYGLDYVMTVRDYRALAGGPFELVPWDLGFDHARAVKSDVGARVGARQRAHQHRGLLDLPRELRGRAAARPSCWRPASSGSSSRAAAG